MSERHPPYSDDPALAAALAVLAAGDPVIAAMLAATGPVAPRRRPGGFPGLVGIVMGQQVSTQSAAAIMGRVVARFDPLTPAAIAAATEADLRDCGLSAAKIRTVKALAEAIAAGSLDLDTLGDRPADEAHAILCGCRGIGPWTADVYLLFCLGHPDAFPAGDLALQEAARLAHGWDARPGARDLTARADAWRPHRAAAATLLWAYYRVARGREGVVG